MADNKAALSPEHKSLIAELCEELGLGDAQRDTVMATLEYDYRLGVLLDMAVNPNTSKTNRRSARAAIKRQIRKLVRRS